MIRIMLTIVLVAAGFVAGFLVRENSALLQSLGFSESVTGVAEVTPTDATTAQKDVYNAVSPRVSEVEDILAKDSLDTYNLDTVTEGALKAFSDASEDPFLRYYSEARYADLMSDQGEGYAGVGVLFSEYNGQAYVVDVFDGSPAQKEGVQEGDFVVAIQGDRSQQWSRSEVASVLSQAQGSTVVIDWRRPESLEAAGGEEFTTSLQVAEYDEPNVTAEYDGERTVGYVKVQQLTQNASTFVQSAVESLTAQGARAFVLDLRDNPGGYLSQAIALASLFMSSGNVVEVSTREGVSPRPASGQPVTASPLVVIANRNTAAAAEVVAAALKESQRATIVGTNTMGKGSVQVLSQLSFGGALRYTAAYYLTPAGRDINNVGVTPDFAIDASAEGDSQRDYAMELAVSQIVEEP